MRKIRDDAPAREVLEKGVLEKVPGRLLKTFLEKYQNESKKSLKELLDILRNDFLDKL